METSNSTNPIAFNFDKATIERIVGQQIEQFRFEAMKTCAINKQFIQERLAQQLSEVLNCTVTDEMSNAIVESFYQPQQQPLGQNVQNFFNHFDNNSQNNGGSHQNNRKFNPRKHNRYRMFKNSSNNNSNQGPKLFQLNHLIDENKQLTDEKKASSESLKNEEKIANSDFRKKHLE